MEDVEERAEVDIEGEPIGTGVGPGNGVGPGTGVAMGVGPGRGVAIGAGGRAPLTSPGAAVPTNVLVFSSPTSCTMVSGLAVALCERTVKSLVNADRPLASMLEDIAYELVEVSELEKDESWLVMDAEFDLLSKGAVKLLW